MLVDDRYAVLFEPVQIGPVRTKNRFFAAPHATGHGPQQPNGSIAMRETKAEGGWGVVATQVAEIDPSSNISNVPMDTFWDETDMRAHARLVEKLHAHGALGAIEIAHTGLRSRNLTTGLPVMSPSALPILKPDAPIQAKRMDLSDIRAFRASHRRAALRARSIGYDIVYVYASHDASLVSHFLSRRYNKRTDEYGGSFTNRLRLLREVLEDTRDVVGDRCAVALRFAVHEFHPELPMTSDGEGRDVVEALAELPDLWDVNVAGWSRDSSTSRFEDEGFQEPYTAFVKRITGKPVVGVGRYTSPDRMVSLIKKGHFDLIGAARPSIADPFLPRKIEENRIEDIRECIGCNVCVAADAYSVPLRCTQNPTISEEYRRGWKPDRIDAAAEPRSVLVVGAGPAGLECALTAARAGHKVTLAEGSDVLGGRVAREARLAGLSAWGRVRDYRAYQLQQLSNVDIYLSSPLGADDVLGFEADVVVLATGAKWRRDGLGSTCYMAIPGLETTPFLTPDDVFAGATVDGPVVIYDDEHHYIGGVLAEHLARAGNHVTLVTPLPIVSAWTAYTLEQPRIAKRMYELGVDVRTTTSVTSVEKGVVHLAAADTGAEMPSISGATLLMVTARYGDESLGEALAGAGLGGDRLMSIGDLASAGTIQAAVFAGHRAARMICGDGLAAGPYRRERGEVLV